MTAKEGVEALAMVAEAKPDLILLDITCGHGRLPGLQGIKQNPVTRKIPGVLLSGKDGFFDKVKGRLAARPTISPSVP